jgi:hypothetical protein
MKKSMISAFAVGLCITVNLWAQVPNYVPTNGLVGWWPFNGNANDESGNGNNGTNNGATLTADRFGNVNKSYLFTPNNFIEVIGSANINFTDSLTVNCWYKNNIVQGGVFISKHINGSLNSSFILYNEPVDGCGPTNYITDINNQIKFVRNPSLCDTVNWHMLSFVFKKPTLKIFSDGIFIDSTSSVGSIKATTNPILFGSGSISTPPFSQSITNSKLDDIGIWNRALTQQEITDLYNANVCYEYVTVTDTLVINTGITGYNPITYMNTLKIWPNPTNDHITIDAGDLTTMNGYSIKIEDAQGQQVFQNAVNQQQFYIDITTWGGNGLYFVRIIDPQGNTVDIKKIVLQ